MTLQEEREACRDRIRDLREQISKLQAEAEQADDLDRRILELDQNAKEQMLDAQMEHFQDLGRLILKLQKIQMIEEDRQCLKELNRITSGIDLEKMARDEDEIEARRSLMREELE